MMRFQDRLQAHQMRELHAILSKAIPGLGHWTYTKDQGNFILEVNNEVYNLGPIVLDAPELSREIGKMVSKLHSKKGPLNREPLNEYEMSLVPWHHVIKPEELYCIPNWRFRVPRYLRRVRNADVGFDQHGNLVWIK